MGKRTNGAALAALRERLAQTAARMMIEGGIEDYGFAKRKAEIAAMAVDDPSTGSNPVKLTKKAAQTLLGNAIDGTL